MPENLRRKTKAVDDQTCDDGVKKNVRADPDPVIGLIAVAEG